MSPKKTKVVVKLTRRDFLTVAAAAVGSVIAAEVLTTGPLSPFSALQQEQAEKEIVETRQGSTSGIYHWGMVIDLDKCIGCEYCQRACSATNDVAADKPWNLVVQEKTAHGKMA
jgi:NAD-dependent dihydropyrimidine dehydrogenase PreA subunit